jgi:hypothetical protein
MHAVFTISPKKHARHSSDYDDSPECLLTYIVQVRPLKFYIELWRYKVYIDTTIPKKVSSNQARAAQQTTTTLTNELLC